MQLLYSSMALQIAQNNLVKKNPRFCLILRSVRLGVDSGIIRKCSASMPCIPECRVSTWRHMKASFSLWERRENGCKQQLLRLFSRRSGRSSVRQCHAKPSDDSIGLQRANCGRLWRPIDNAKRKCLRHCIASKCDAGPKCLHTNSRF